jgi:hypothetical protein
LKDVSKYIDAES